MNVLCFSDKMLLKAARKVLLVPVRNEFFLLY
jgi:hypothetical protein